MPITCRVRPIRCAVVASAAGLAVACGAPAADPPTGLVLAPDTPVVVTGGEIRGAAAETNDAIIAFKGIPYAAPPVGDRRWRPPAPVVPWDGVRDAGAAGPICVQTGGRDVTQDEDCLFLNVWAPREASAPLPVMFWIHGGGYTGGSGSSALYDGTPLAADESVVVTINYRLNVFGFMAHPALSAESAHGASGNYGLMDMVAALEWVRDNIAAVGGDPDRVTIFGESAGGGAVMSVMLMPQSAGLFHRAIAESTWIHGWDRPLAEAADGWEPAEAQGVRVAEALGVAGADDPLGAMRAADAAAVLDASTRDDGSPFRHAGNVWAPNVDGWTIPDHPLAMYDAGRQHDVPLITGMNGNEGSMMTGGLNIDTPDAFESHIREVYAPHAPDLLAHYDVSSPDTAKAGIDHLIHDMYFAGPVRAHAVTQATRTSPVWLYHFTHVPPTPMGNSLGSHHAAELVYVFGTLTRREAGGERPLGLTPVGDFTDADRQLSDTMRAYWRQFAATGDPNRDDLPHWPRFTADGDEHLELGRLVVTGQALHADGAALWRAIETSRRADD